MLYSDSNFIEVRFKGSHWQDDSIGLDNGLAPNQGANPLSDRPMA